MLNENNDCQSVIQTFQSNVDQLQTQLLNTDKAMEELSLVEHRLDQLERNNQKTRGENVELLFFYKMMTEPSKAHVELMERRNQMKETKDDYLIRSTLSKTTSTTTTIRKESDPTTKPWIHAGKSTTTQSRVVGQTKDWHPWDNVPAYGKQNGSFFFIKKTTLFLFVDLQNKPFYLEIIGIHKKNQLKIIRKSKKEFTNTK